MNMHFLHMSSRDRLLPSHQVRHSRPIIAWLVSTAALAIAVAAVALGEARVQAERERIGSYFAKQDAIAAAKTVTDQRITIAYENSGIVCTVPPAQERAAAVVYQSCNALAGALKHAGVTK